MDIKRLKLFGGMTLLALSLLTSQVNNVVYAEDEILYEEEGDDFVLEDIPAGETPEATAEPTAEPTTEPTAEPTTEPTAEPTPETSSAPEEDNPLENTTIDPEDEEYNTGRTEIPDSVETEADRKGITTPEPTEEPTTPPQPTEEPTTPPQPTPQPTPEPTQPTPEPTTPEPTQPTTPDNPQPIPKTGFSIVSKLLACGGVGLIIGSLINLKSACEYDALLEGKKVVKSRKKYKRKNKIRGRK